MHLVIVESPTKAKTISSFLDKNFVIRSSYGHVRDLPEKELGVDLKNNFKPHYVIPRKKYPLIKELKALAQKAEKIYFATDEDREGEAIAWHLNEILNPPQEKVLRIAFHEITKEAIFNALKNPRTIDLNLVNAQQARRILDRLVGYELSPLLWKKIARGLSAGRVQSPALRLIVEREREILNFKPQEYWTLSALLFSPQNPEQVFEAKLYKINQAILDKFDLASESKTQRIQKEIEGCEFEVMEINKKEARRIPPPPFITSTLQQEAFNKLGFSAKQTMLLAQELYEGLPLESGKRVGLITYMRTDSVNLSEKFLTEARNFIQENFGSKYLPAKPRRFSVKTKLAQEAHEAIRPTDPYRTPEKIQPYLNPQQFKLYQLIWQRALSCQMSEAIVENTTIEIKASKPTQTYFFKATGMLVKFDGFYKIYNRLSEKILPSLAQGEKLSLKNLVASQHFTEPPSRYTDASLVKELEDYGIGRPSTYAPIISTLLERGYIERDKNRRFIPTEIGFLVNDLLTKHFPEIVDYQFTANLEDNLDLVAQGKKEWVSLLKEFYGPFKEKLEKKYQEIQKEDILSNYSTEEVCEKCGSPMVIKISRFGRYLACSAFPKCRNIKPFNSETKSLGIPCPKCQKGEIVEKRTKRKKIFYGCSNYPECDFSLWNKPTGEKCPKCGSLMVEKGKKVVCSNKECSS